MEQNKFLKIFSLCAFVAFAAVSCWATAESLHLLLPDLPEVLCWIITIGFFVIASIGSKMIVDSLNQNIYMEKRGLNLVGGIVILLIFWLVCSMPTNTHTFFYRLKVADVTLADLRNTERYLHDIRDNRSMTEKYNNAVEKLRAELSTKKQALEVEIMGPNRGDGPIADGIRSDIARLLQCGTIHKIGGPTATKTQLRAIVNAYMDMINRLEISRINDMRVHMINETRVAQAKKDATEDINRIQKAIEGIEQMKQDNVLAQDDINKANSYLKGAYSTIKNYSDMILFDPKSDEDIYIADNQITRTTRLTSVIDTWIDFLTGKFEIGFIFWVVISILVDVAAFVFFDIAFKKSEN